MALEEDVFTQLSGFAALTTLVPSTRITPRRRKQGGTLPAVAYWRVSGERIRLVSKADAGCERSRIQVDSYATTYSGMKAVQAQVRAAMEASTSAWELLEVALGSDFYDDAEELHIGTVDFVMVN